MNLKVKQNWERFFDLYLKSGLSKADFCRSQKMPPSKFFYYAKLHQRTALQKTSVPSNLFLPVSDKKDFKIKINGNVEICFESTPDALWVANFINSLGGAHART